MYIIHNTSDEIMNMDWRNAIKSNDLLYSACVFGKSVINREYRKKMTDFYRNNNYLCIQHMGELNRGQIIFIIDPVGLYAAGFFSIFHTLLRYLHFADVYGLVPVIKYNQNTHYLEKEQFMGTDNVFEYFFEQPGGVSLSEAFESAAVCFAEQKASYLIGAAGNVDEDTMIVDTMRKYIKFNEPTYKILSEESEQYIGSNKVLGVKYRGTGYLMHRFKGHPQPFEVDEMIPIIKMEFERGYDKIYLATEDEEALVKFKQYFGNNLSYNEGIRRAKHGQNHFDLAIDDSVIHPAYNEGLGVLKDVWILSKAQSFIGTDCGVSRYVKYFNEAFQDNRFLLMNILSKGLIKHGRDSRIVDKWYGK